MKKLIRVSAAAEILDVPEERVYKMAREGLIPVVRVGRQLRIDPEQLSKWISQGGKTLSGGWKNI